MSWNESTERWQITWDGSDAVASWRHTTLRSSVLLPTRFIVVSCFLDSNDRHDS
jgi:hypothetical protein